MVGLLPRLHHPDGVRYRRLPFAVHLPRWVEAEVVLAAWWLTWAVVLAVLAYRGRRLDETHRLELRGPFETSAARAIEAPTTTSSPAAAPTRSRWYHELGSGLDGELLLFLIAVAIVIGIALAAAWVVVELAAPAVLFLAYLGIARARRRALAASHRGEALRSGLHGAVWATAYVVPHYWRYQGLTPEKHDFPTTDKQHHFQVSVASVKLTPDARSSTLVISGHEVDVAKKGTLGTPSAEGLWVFPDGLRFFYEQQTLCAMGHVCVCSTSYLVRSGSTEVIVPEAGSIRAFGHDLARSGKDIIVTK